MKFRRNDTKTDCVRLVSAQYFGSFATSLKWPEICVKLKLVLEKSLFHLHQEAQMRFQFINSRVFVLLTVAFVLIALPLSALAQSGTSGVRGIVADQNGAAVAGATVTLTNPSTGFNRSTVTTEDGARTVSAAFNRRHTVWRSQQPVSRR